ncbi:hypothetical protein ACRAWD_03730 [Caulobacter segnis]
MVEQGALDEVRAMEARGLNPSLPALKAVGYREFAAHLRGETTLDQALDAARQETSPLRQAPADLVPQPDARLGENSRRGHQRSVTTPPCRGSAAA